jgi:hypothetical protein
MISGPYRKLWFGLYALKLLLALAVTLPVLVLIQADLDYSAFAKPLLSEWSVDIIGELIVTNDNIFSAGMLFLLGTGLLAFLAKQFLNGGIYDCLINGQPLRRDRFFAQSARMFLQHLTISLWMIVVFVLLFLAAMLVGEFVSGIARRVIPTLDLTRFSIRMIVTYSIILIGAVFSDFVRFHRTLILQGDSVGIGGIGQSFKAGYLLLVRKFFRSMATYLAYFLPFVLVWLAIEGLALLITGGLGNLLGAIIEFVLFQLCAMARVWQSLAGSLALSEIVKSDLNKHRIEESSDRTPVLP